MPLSSQPKSPSRFAHALTAMVLACLACLTFAVPPAQAVLPEGTLWETHFSDGQWQLYLTPSITYNLNMPQVQGVAHWTMSGTGSFAVRDETISSGGLYEAAGSGNGVMTTGEGNGTISGRIKMDGKVVGTADSAKLTGTGSLDGRMLATVRGNEISQPLSFTGPIDPPAHLAIFSASCDTVAGSFTLEYESLLRGFSITTTGEGTFTAVRVGEPGIEADSATGLGRKVLRLMAEAGAMTAAAERGEFDIDAIVDLLARAEELQGELPTTRGECRSELPWFTSVIGPAMHELLSAISEHASEIPADKLARIISSGYRSGAIGDASEPAQQLERKFEQALGEALERAIAAGDAEAIAAIQLAAAEFGWDDLADAADEAAAS